MTRYLYLPSSGHWQEMEIKGKEIRKEKIDRFLAFWLRSSVEKNRTVTN